jgi:uncharacterized protein YndB with AHSA1/START domain
MTRETISIEIGAPCETVFDLVHDYDQRLKWDSMLSEATILDKACAAGVGVRTRCVGKWRSAWTVMVTEYVNFDPGRVAAVKLINRSFFIERFAATIRHESLSETRSRLAYTYSFQTRPKRLAFLFEPIVNAVLRSETMARLQSLRDFLER